MKKLLLCALLSACAADSGSADLKETPLAGTVGGKTWTFVAGDTGRATANACWLPCLLPRLPHVGIVLSQSQHMNLGKLYEDLYWKYAEA